MPARSTFPGFPRECPAYFKGLQRNNNRVWFEQHRPDFEKHVLDPARAFVVEMGARLKHIAPDIHADPRIDRSIFRIFRDTRFSPDKTPYKSHLGIWLWEGDGPRMECSGFYFQLEPKNFILGAGVYMVPPGMLDSYREAVVDPRHGKTLRRAVQACLEVPGCTIGGRHYKRVPRGYDPQHPNAELLLHTGLWAGTTEPLPATLYTPAIVEQCYERFAAALPMHRWLRDMIGRARAERADTR
jgi:uncharacterized protein (TIGR02453 family)